MLQAAAIKLLKSLHTMTAHTPTDIDTSHTFTWGFYLWEYNSYISIIN